MSPQYAEHGHLGGYIVGGDLATYCPTLWTWLVTDYGVESVIDVGCGEGHAVDFFEELGVQAVGIDGVPQDNEGVLVHDYTLGPKSLTDSYGQRWDLCWSCEFVEHVEEQYVPNFLATFREADLLLMTHAEPGQPGYHHVNCQPAAYWIGAMAAIGFVLDGYLTAQTRALAPGTHYARSGLAFKRT